MTEIRVETTIESDGELHLRQLPCRKGDRVSAIVSIPTQSDDGEREAARRRHLDRDSIVNPGIGLHSQFDDRERLVLRIGNKNPIRKAFNCFQRNRLKAARTRRWQTRKLEKPFRIRFQDFIDLLVSSHRWIGYRLKRDTKEISIYDPIDAVYRQ